MDQKRAKGQHHLGSECARTRLAQNSTVAVDVCTDCGMLHLHIGPLTMRLAPCAVSELIATLQMAVAKQHGSTDGESGLFEASGVRKRGQA